VDGTAWVVETVDSAEQVGRDNSLALDAAGRPHISYTDVTNGVLKYARWDGTTWLIQSVDSAVGPDSPDTALAYPSLALDGAGRAHISYSNLDDHDLKYAYWDGTAWVIHTVDRGEPNPSTNLAPAMAFTSLALDRSGHPHISYSSLGDLDIKYAHWDGTAWTTETVDGEEMAGLWGTSLALDEADHPHISYFSYLSPDATANTLRYAHWDGTAWIIETVGGAGHAGFYPSLALDRSGQPHISYDSSASVGNSSLKYAHRDDTAWIVETVVGGGISPSLALDENGDAHISYHGFTGPHGPAVGYAHWDGTAWVNETVDNVMFAFDQMAFFVSDTSLVLDEAGQPHISYHDATNGYLKYAHRFVPTESMYLPAVLSSREARVW
jgi:hypothetical protein